MVKPDKRLDLGFDAQSRRRSYDLRPLIEPYVR
ncbi:hypothetical protein C5S32_01205, partial [ANME-1 cluster archaeon GoMg1]|nr:hypothetical protein [ANME-1 cluster archaeon GoMg1]